MADLTSSRKNSSSSATPGSLGTPTSGALVVAGSTRHHYIKERVYARFKPTGMLRSATILDIEYNTADGSPLRYFVTWTGETSRMDLWVGPGDVNKDPSATTSKAKSKAGSALMTSQYSGYYTPNSSGSGAGGTGIAGQPQPQSMISTRSMTAASNNNNAATSPTPASPSSSSAVTGSSGGKSATSGVKPVTPTTTTTKTTTTTDGAVVARPVIPPRSTTSDSAFFSRAKNVQRIFMGKFNVECWYFSPYLLARPSVRGALSDSINKAQLRNLTSLTIRHSPMSRETSCTNNNNNTVAGTAGATTGETATAASSSSSGQQLTTGVSEFFLHLCPFCAFPFCTHADVIHHIGTNVCLRRPPGDEIYRDVHSRVCMFVVDGKVHPMFCQHLALLAKLFLEHKFLDYDMEPFVFYILCQMDPELGGCVITGYFSKEKRTPDDYNLSCILTLPQFQGQGLGRFLVEVSYELSKRLNICGTPERPLSDLGERVYKSYWRETVLDVICAHDQANDQAVSLEVPDIMSATGMSQEDVLLTLRSNNLSDNKGQIHVTAELKANHYKAKISRRERTPVMFEPQLLLFNASQYKMTCAPVTVEFVPRCPNGGGDSAASDPRSKRTRE